jgi:hypothetical protein
LQQKETVIVRRYSTVFLLPPQKLYPQGFIFRQIQELCKIQKFALKSTGFYVNIVQGFCFLSCLQLLQTPARIELRLD